MVYESEYDGIIRQFVREGKALAWLSKQSVEAELAEGQLVHAGPDEWDIPLTVNLYRDVFGKNELANHIWLSALPHE